jgi:hypothetical protein
MDVNDNACGLSARVIQSFSRASSLLQKCVHRNVTIGAIYVCTFRFCAPKSYIPPTDVRRHALLNPLRKINTCSIGQFKLTIFQQLGEKP